MRPWFGASTLRDTRGAVVDMVFVNPRVQAALPNYLLGPFESIELSAGHWLIEEEPDRVVDAIMAHLQRQPDSMGM